MRKFYIPSEPFLWKDDSPEEEFRNAVCCTAELIAPPGTKLQFDSNEGEPFVKIFGLTEMWNSATSKFEWLIENVS